MGNTVVNIQSTIQNGSKICLFLIILKQCCGSGSGSVGFICFWVSWIRIRICHYFYGSGSFYQQAKKLGKILISTIFLLLLDFLSLKTNVNVPSKGNTQKRPWEKKLTFCWHLVRHWRKKQDPNPSNISRIHNTDLKNINPELFPNFNEIESEMFP